MADSESFERTPDEITSHIHVPDEYEAGYLARQMGISEFKTATWSWRAEWQDADRELAGFNMPPSFATTSSVEQWSLYGTGAQARACGLPFDEERGEAWKRSWVEADIALEFQKPRG